MSNKKKDNKNKLNSLPKEYYKISQEFFTHILKTNYEDEIINKNSMLSDYICCGSREKLMDNQLTLTQIHQEWEKEILKRIKNYYGTTIKTTHTYLLNLFDLLKK